MSKNLTNASIQQFDAEVKAAYEAGARLRPWVRTKTGVVGESHRFPVFGKGIATPRVPQTDVIPMNITNSKATATLEDWNAPEYTDIFDQAEVNWSERQELARVIANAIGRREDQLIIDAMDAASTTLTVSNDIGGADTGLNVAKLRRAARLLDDQAVPMMDRKFLGSTVGKEQLLGETETTSSDFNTVKALVSGDINTFLGFEFCWMETRTEGGLAIDGSNDRTNFAWHMPAVGLAIGIDQTVSVDWVPEKTSWLSNKLFKAGAVTIDALGLVELTTREA